MSTILKTNISRVSERVKRGGHDVPIEDIRRRYKRSLNNLSKAIEIADTAMIYDNSDRQCVLVATIESGSVSMHVDRSPIWCCSVLDAI